MGSHLYLLCLVLIVSCAPEVEHRWPDIEKEEQRQTMLEDMDQITAVLSGDTIKLKDGRVIKYHGVQAPQRGEPFFEESRRANLKLLSWGRNRVAVVEESKDSQGRYQCNVYTPSKILPHDKMVCCFVNKELLEYGFVTLKREDPKSEFQEEFEILEDQARNEQRGIWKIQN